MSNKVAESITKEDLLEAKLLAEKGEDAVREAEESGDIVLMTRADLARSFFLNDFAPLSVVQSRFEVLFQSSADALMTLEPPDWRFTAGNPAAVKMFGAKDEEDFKSRAPWEYSPEFQTDGQPSSNKAKEMIIRAMEEGSHYFEWMHRKIGGPDFPATVLLTRFALNNREVLQATVRDVSRLTQAESGLRREQYLNRLLLDSLPHAALIIDQSRQVIAANKLAIEQGAKIGGICWRDFGHSLSLPSACRAKIDPSDPSSCTDIKCTFCLADGALAEGETKIDNSVIIGERVYEVYWTPLEDQGLFLHYSLDVTDKRISEKEIEAQKIHVENILNTVSTAIVQLNRDGIISLLNSSACDMLECKQDEAEGKNWFDTFIPEEDRLRTLEVFKALMRGEEEAIEYFENLVKTKTGQQKLVAWHNALIRDDEGVIIGSLSSGEDVTRSRQLESQLRVSHKMEAIGQLAGGVAHDFNNLLAVILGTTELARQDLSEDHPVSADLTSIQQAGSRAAELVAQLLAFSKKQVLKPSKLVISKCLQDLEKMSRSAIPEDIKLSFTFDSSLDSIEVDPVQFERALLNLLLNARDAMPEGGELRVSASNRYLQEADLEKFGKLQAGRYVQIVVKDTGMGIPPENLNRVFDPFFTTKGNRGTGLGLASVYGIVQQSGGDITVESTVGHGTAFNLLLPSAGHDSAIPASGQRNPEVYRIEGNIVVIEDEAMLRKVTKKILEKFGLKAIAFDGGNSFFKFFDGKSEESFPFSPEEVDLVISDVKMPGMNGPKLIEELRKRNPDIEVLFVSGHADETHGIDSLEYPFLQKPYSFEELSNMLKRLLPPKREKL